MLLTKQGTDLMAEQVPAVSEVLAAIEARNWDRLEHLDRSRERNSR
jgi:hypothetical protein